MQADALLTQDELDFIQNMQHSPQFNLADTMSSLLVNGDRRIQTLLTRLVANEQVTLQAQFNNQQISFPLQLVEDEFHAVSLQLGAPSIYEDGPMMRPWRLNLDTPVALDDELGLSTDLRVREISFKGVLLEMRKSIQKDFFQGGYQSVCNKVHPATLGTLSALETTCTITENGRHVLSQTLVAAVEADKAYVFSYAGQAEVYKASADEIVAVRNSLKL